MANPYPPIAGVIRANWTFSDGVGKFGFRTFWLASTSPYSVSDLNYLASHLSSLWSTNMASSVSNTFQLQRIDTVDLGEANGLKGVWQGSISGTATATTIPSNCTVNIRPILTQRYRGGHPVIHHPPPNSGQLSNQRNWSSSYCSSVASAWQALVTAVEALSSGNITGTLHVVPLHWRPGAPAANVVVATPQSYVVPTLLGTMRRRLTSVT